MGELIGMIVAGAIIGALARFLKPGEQNIGILWTIILGALGAFIGGWLSGLLGVQSTPGIDWIRWIISIIVAVVLIGIYMSMSGRKED
ncbi:MAG: GlsB/YeaQ/YmgE family stress response membrane protein [Actinomycetaceae bacterium]|nr:GlsB/YeaQ/YmgE family stress response membrane protein [Actinomycetaceae bacterium]MDY6083183.1 GlsB/YeaQ/YmgE family stress response membrane protein [Actinomycetaceae bacterium]